MYIVDKTTNDHYDEGYKSGVVTSFSQKGIYWKTWEGELNLGGASGYDVIPNTWRFSLDEEELRNEDKVELRKQLTEAQKLGKRVRLHYIGEVLVAPWRAGTTKLIQKVEIMN